MGFAKIARTAMASIQAQRLCWLLPLTHGFTSTMCDIYLVILKKCNLLTIIAQNAGYGWSMFEKVQGFDWEPMAFRFPFKA